MTRSSTEYFLSSNQNKSSTPFGSILVPYSNDKQTNTICEDQEIQFGNKLNNQATNMTLNKVPRERRRYTVDFLLARSDIPSSKKLPKNWKELNVKYPNICFCGKVYKIF